MIFQVKYASEMNTEDREVKISTLEDLKEFVRLRGGDNGIIINEEFTEIIIYDDFVE